jgi:large subunit ribosomal protein LP0
MVSNAFRNLLAIAVETDYTFKEAEQIKDMIANPEKFAAIAAPVAAAAAPAAAAAAPAEEAKPAAKEESDEESDDDMGFGLFD